MKSGSTGKKGKYEIVGVVLWLVFWLAACVPTSEPIAIGPTRPSATAVSPTTTPVISPTITNPITTTALLARWDTGTSRYEIRPVDATTGQDVPGYTPLPLAGERTYTPQSILSANGRTLAAIETNGETCEASGGGSACRARATGLRLVDVAIWQGVTANLSGEGWVGPMAFSPDGSRLALAYHHENSSLILLFHAASGIQLGRHFFPYSFRPTLMAFTDDGSLVLAGAADGEKRGITPPGPFTVLLLDGVTLAEQWALALPEVVSGSWCTAVCDGPHDQQRTESWQPGVVAAPGGRALYIVHANEDKLTTVDLPGRTAHTTAIQPAQTWLERLLALTAETAVAKSMGDGAYKQVALSADGRRLYILGERWQVVTDAQGQPVQQQESLGVQVVDVSDGRLLQTKETPANRLRLTPDGAYLLLDGWDDNGRWFEVWNATTLVMVTRLEGLEITAVPLLNSEGGYALLAGNNVGHQIYLRLMVAPYFKCAPVWTADDPIIWLAGW
ncbi:MAG: hypothetical protein KF770_20595 [Anaerolineae bacterium]|nr:hypothetical protein [Anaerolineae bacterium]